MSGSASQSLRLDESSSPTVEYGNQADFQQEFDSSQNANPSASTATMSAPRKLDSTMDISASQKMLSAVSGSLLTSLLGMMFFRWHSNNQ